MALKFRGSNVKTEGFMELNYFELRRKLIDLNFQDLWLAEKLLKSIEISTINASNPLDDVRKFQVIRGIFENIDFLYHKKS